MHDCRLLPTNESLSAPRGGYTLRLDDYPRQLSLSGLIKAITVCTKLIPLTSPSSHKNCLTIKMESHCKVVNSVSSRLDNLLQPFPLRNYTTATKTTTTRRATTIRPQSFRHQTSTIIHHNPNRDLSFL